VQIFFTNISFLGEYGIHALVNNAAVFYLPLEQTKDNFDVTFQTNYLGTSI
jgi:NAD(P)-dependent dehydrogenase (short-subunit alcohol dehydrogenase family)